MNSMIEILLVFWIMYDTCTCKTTSVIEILLETWNNGKSLKNSLIEILLVPGIWDYGKRPNDLCGEDDVISNNDIHVQCSCWVGYGIMS